MYSTLSIISYAISIISFISGNVENGRYFCILGLLFSIYSKLKDE